MQTFKFKKIKNNGVSEVLGTILLLGISISLFSIIYVSIFSIQAEPSPPTAYLVGTIKNNELFLEHKGGEELDLDTNIILRFNDGTTKNIKADESTYLATEYKSDNKWNIGEKLNYSLNIEPSYSPFEPLDVLVVDKKSNSVIMSGIVKEQKKADLELIYDINNPTPMINDPVELNVIVKNNGPSDTENVEVEIKIPEGLSYINTPETIYNPQTKTCIWKAGQINSGDSNVLTIAMDTYIIGPEEMDFTHLILLIDGSAACTNNQFSNILQGISDAVSTTIPHNDMIELTIIQYGGENNPYPTSRLEIGPVVLTDSNYNSIASNILMISKMNGYTPMDCGFLRAGNTIFNSPNFQSSNKQSVLVFAAGLPDAYVKPEDEWRYYATRPWRDDVAYEWGKIAAYARRDEMITKLTMSSDQDEINSLLMLNPYVFPDSNNPWDDPTNITWIKNNIAWPGSLYVGPSDDWPPSENGWVRGVLTDAEILNAIDEIFSITIEPRTITSQISNSRYYDPVVVNNNFNLIISPIS